MIIKMSPCLWFLIPISIPILSIAHQKKTCNYRILFTIEHILFCRGVHFKVFEEGLIKIFKLSAMPWTRLYAKIFHFLKVKTTTKTEKEIKVNHINIRLFCVLIFGIHNPNYKQSLCVRRVKRNKWTGLIDLGRFTDWNIFLWGN